MSEAARVPIETYTQAVEVAGSALQQFLKDRPAFTPHERFGLGLAADALKTELEFLQVLLDFPVAQ